MTIASVLRFLFILGEVLLFYNLLIAVHEFGHFWAARWRGLVVERFAIWMGPALWKKRYQGVDYVLGSIPIGGYVALPQMAPMEAIEGRSESNVDLVDLPPITPLDKIIVAAAGPLASFGFAVFCAFLVWILGRPVTEAEATTTIGYTHKDSPAAAGGLRAGDKILEVDGKKVTRFIGMGSDAITWCIVRSEGESIQIKYEREGQVHETWVKPHKESRKFFQRPSLRKIEVAPAVIPSIKEVVHGTLADTLGFHAKDRVIALNGKKIYHLLNLLDYMDEHPGQPVAFTCQAETATGFDTREITVTPIKADSMEDIIPGLHWNYEGKSFLAHPSPWEQIVSSVSTMVNTIGAIVSPKSDIKIQQLNGPVKIINIYYLIFDGDEPWRRILWFSVLININLAVLNMLPIPVLDGGHILMALVEKIRGKPHNVRLLEFIQTACVCLVLSFLLYITFFDVQDLPWGSHAAKPKEKTPVSAPAPTEAK